MSVNLADNAVKVYEQPGRIAGMPVDVHANVKVEFSANRELTMKSAKGQLSMNVHPSVHVELSDSKLSLLPIVNAENSKAHAGTARALANNMMTGLVNGFEKNLFWLA